MKAAFYERYGGPDGLTLREVDKPEPKAGEVLVELRAVSVNLTDWEYLTGRPAYARINGLFRPRRQVLGSDIAGIVRKTGPDVTRFQPGDAVFGDILYTLGGFAEFVCAKQADLIGKPDALSFVEAAAIPQAGVIALQGVQGRVKAGDRVLINGGGGGGSFAIQIAKRLGAEVTGVDNALKQELMRDLGADHVIDYAREDFCRTGERYDLILDLVVSRPATAVARALTPAGRYLAVGGTLRVLLNLLVIGAAMSLLSRRKIGLLGVHPGPVPLAGITAMIVSGQVRPVVGRCFPLAETAAAIAWLGAGKSRGKIVVTMGESPAA